MGISIYIILSGAIGVLIGAFLAGLIIKNNSKKIEDEAREKARSLVREAEITAEGIRKDKILEA